MDHNINAHCSICNKGYHICGTCKKEKNFKPWRRVTDTAEHYKIYMAIHGYAITKNKEQAGAELQHCDLSDMNSFKPEIRAVIEEITAKPVNAMAVPKNKRK
ncbi:MAG: hypothetical protein K2P64_06810 [Lachnospiraceae bacterium]|nr:hypothetical protein [Lachnospiraceae bacterium]